jgi:8-oxo-dGTP pyrophosphatase MutT (NUDIX family)
MLTPMNDAFMLYFYSPPPDADLDALVVEGVHRQDGSSVRLYTHLADALHAAGDGPVLVVEDQVLDAPPRAADTRHVIVPSVSPAALQNVKPYVPPRAVTAAGGYVARPLDDDAVALLLIFRRGAWDLPKGKQDEGETVEACALREVREEVGVEALHMVRPLGTTLHGYARNGHYDVKTTHWFLMRTPECSFEPERREGIERVAWARWDVAYRHMGYDTLRRHMDRCEGDVRTVLRDASSMQDP